MSDQERCPTVTVTAIWSRRIGDKVETLVEHDGVWKLVITEHFDGPFSHIAEARGLDNWAHDSTPSSVAEQPSREQAVEGLVRHLGQALRQWKSYAEEFEGVDLEDDVTVEAEMYRSAQSAYEAASRGERQ